MDSFYGLDNLKNQLASVDFCRNTEVCNVWNGAMMRIAVTVSINGFPHH